MLLSLILLYFFFLPFQWALSPAEGIDLALIRLFTLVIILVWIGFGMIKRKITLPHPLTTFFLSAFLVTAALSYLWAPNQGFAFRKIFFLCSFLPLFFVLSSLFQESKSMKERVLKFFVFGAFLSALVGIVQFFLQFILGLEKTFQLWIHTILPFFLGSAFGESVATYPSLLVNISGETILRASAFFPDPHMFSFYMGMSLPLALSFFLEKGSRQRVWWLVIFLTLLLADLLSFSRGGYLGLAMGSIVFTLAYFLPKTWDARRVFASFGLTLCIVLSIAFSPFGSRLFSSFSLEDGSNMERIRLFKEALVFTSERPLFGTGLGNYPLLVKPSVDYREPLYAHNLYLDIALELGLIGLTFFLGFLLYGIFSAWHVWKSEQALLSLGLCVSLIVFATHAFFETPLFSVHILPALLLLVAGSVL